MASTSSPPRKLELSSEAFADYLATLADRYPIISIEDGMAEGDWDGWKILTDKLGKPGADRRRRSFRHQSEDHPRRHSARASPIRC
jgi:hypothetical protein